jgi:hypothetical protein
VFDGLIPALRSTIPTRLELDTLDGINNNLLGFWPLTEPGGTVADDLSPTHSRGTLVGAPPRIVGTQGRATDFNGSSQYITTSRRQEIPGGFSAVAWINVATGFDRVILSSIYSTDNTILWRVTSNGTQLDFWANTGVAQATASGLPSFADRWVCAGVSWAPGRATRFYINGVDVGGGTTAGDIQSPISAWHIGRYGVPGIWYFDGSMRMVRTWARTLPQSDFKRVYVDPYAGTYEPASRLFHALKAPATGVTVALTGTAATAAVGTLGVSRTTAITGVAGTSAAGTLSPSLALALTGVEGIADVGDVGIGGDKTVALTGVDATGEVGDVAVAVPSGAAGPSRTRRGARRVYLPEPQASAVFHPNALPEDLAPHAVKAWQDDEDDEWFLLA